jgi:hypothetical protein
MLTMIHSEWWIRRNTSFHLLYFPNIGNEHIFHILLFEKINWHFKTYSGTRKNFVKWRVEKEGVFHAAILIVILIWSLLQLIEYWPYLAIISFCTLQEVFLNQMIIS